MKYFEEICEKYNRSAEEVEKDLRYVLKQKRDKEPIQLEAGKEYYLSLVELLKSMRCLEDIFPESVITQEGLRLIKRGYIIYDYESPKRQAERKLQRERLSLLIGFLGIIVGIAGLFLPRQDTVRQPIRELSETEDMALQSTVDFTRQDNEINQATDNTEQQKDSCECK